MRNPAQDGFDLKMIAGDIELSIDRFLDENVSIPNSKSTNLRDIKMHAKKLMNLVKELQEVE